MSHKLENIMGKKLVHLVSEIMARKGYTINIDPITYSGIEILATKETNHKISKYFITTSGRSTSDYLTRSDMTSTLPDPIELSNSSRLLIVTTNRSSSKKARRIAATDPTPKTVWYASNLLENIKSINSEYLIDLYDIGKYQYNTVAGLEERFSYQSMDIGEESINYISSETYHPRKIIAYLELKHYGYNTKDLENMQTIKKFKSKFRNK